MPELGITIIVKNKKISKTEAGFFLIITDSPATILQFGNIMVFLALTGGWGFGKVLVFILLH